jgi:TolB-like protein
MPTTIRSMMTRCVLLALCTACATAPLNRRIAAIASADNDAQRAVKTESAIDPSKIPARALGVLPFAVDAGDTLLAPLGYAMAEFLTTDLSRSNNLQMVDRLRTDAILRELDLVDKGTVDPRTAPRVGRLVGARRLLIGDLHSEPGGTVRIDARVVDVIAGTVQTLVSATAPIERAIDAEKALALRVFEQLGITLTPAQRLAVEQRQTTNLAATVAFGKGLESETRGDPTAAAALFEEAARRDASFSAARNQLAANNSSGSSSSGSRTTGTQRVLSLASEAINAPVVTKPPEAADVALNASLLTILLSIRIF